MGEALWAAPGALVGSLVEGGLEELFPGPPEFGPAAELGSSIAALLASADSRREAQAAFETFVHYAHKRISRHPAPEAVSYEELRAFSQNFAQYPRGLKSQIISGFRDQNPHHYASINELLKEIGKKS